MYALLLLAAATATMQAPLPPELPWDGASRRLIAGATDPWITPAEAAGFRTTPNYAETRAWLEQLDAASPLIRMESFGKSAEGRDLLLVVASKDGGKLDPAKPVLLVQAGIHAGEIDGKDAGMMLLRDIALRGKDRLLDKVNLLFVPIFNADGHERASAFSRPNQRGPEVQGWRATAQNLNLNRDYLKADALEMRAMLGLINRFDPTLYLDIHVTDGIDYQYDVTFGFEGWDGRYARSARIGRWLDTRYRPALMKALGRTGHVPGGLVFARDDRDPDAGVTHEAFTPRFSNGYGDLRRLPTVLVENHSLKPYRQRVLGTYVLIEESLTLLAGEGGALRQAIADDRAARPQTTTLSWKDLAEPVGEIDWLGVRHERYRSPTSGTEEIRWLGKPVRQRMKVYGQAPDRQAKLPAAWWVPATKPELIERLRLHGVRMEPIEEERSVEVEMLRANAPKIGGALEGRVRIEAASFTRERRTERFPAGSVRVPADQPLGELAAQMLEPEGPDSLFAWGFFPEILGRTEYMEGYVIAPLAERMLAEDHKLRAEFEAKLRADPDFAANPRARLAWFYERTPYWDSRYLLYPVGREMPTAVARVD